MPKLRKPPTWRTKLSRVKGAGSVSIRRIKRASDRKLAEQVIAFSGPNKGIVTIMCGENRSRLDLPLHWVPAVIEHLSSIQATSASPEPTLLCPPV